MGSAVEVAVDFTRCWIQGLNEGRTIIRVFRLNKKKLLLLLYCHGKGEICPCRHCRRQCKIFASGVKFTIFTHFFVFLSPKLLTFCEMKGAKFLASKFRRCKFFDKSHVCLSTRWPRLILRWGVEDLHWGPTVIKVLMVLSCCHLQRIL